MRNISRLFIPDIVYINEIVCAVKEYGILEYKLKSVIPVTRHTIHNTT